MIKKLVLFFIIVSIPFLTRAQRGIIKNNSYSNFELLWTSDTSTYGISVPIFVIELVDLDSISVDSLDKQFFLQFLKNDKYDWYCNLLLYHITKKDASRYLAWEIKTRDDWVEKLYESDLQYWEDFLSPR